MKRGYLLLPLFFIFIVVPPVYASENVHNVSLTEIPQYLGERLGISTFAAGIVATSFLLMVCILPIALIARKRKTGFIPELIMGIIGLSIAIGIQWLDYWFLFVICMLIALMFAGKMRDWISGS